MTGVHKLESNGELRLILDSLQMPTVEYKEISVDDYSGCPVGEASDANANANHESAQTSASVKILALEPKLHFVCHMFLFFPNSLIVL